MFWGSVENALNQPKLLASELYYYVIRYSLPKILMAVVLDYFSLMRVRILVNNLSKTNLTLRRVTVCLLGEAVAFICIYYIAWQTFSAIENLKGWSSWELLEMFQWEGDNRPVAKMRTSDSPNARLIA